MSLLAGVDNAGVRPIDLSDSDDLAQLMLLEAEGRAALDGQRGGERWLVEHPGVGDQWVQRGSAKIRSSGWTRCG